MKKIISLVLVLLVGSLSYAGQDLKLTKKSGDIEFTAKGPIVRVSGKGQGVEGDLKVVDGKASGTLILNLKSLESGISLRDDHMKNKYLEVEKFPNAELTLTNIKMPKKLKGKVKFVGMLKLHGVEKQVSGVAKVKGVKSGKLKITADLKIKFVDFKIPVPSFKLVSLGEDVKIKIKATATVNNTADNALKASL